MLGFWPQLQLVTHDVRENYMREEHLMVDGVLIYIESEDEKVVSHYKEIR